MKKLCLLLFTILLSTSFYAQKIGYDKTTDDGSRFLFTEGESIRSFTDKYPMSVKVNGGFLKGGEVKVYSIAIEISSFSPLSIPKSGRLLVKLMNDETLELKTKDEYSDLEGRKSDAGKLYKISPSYSISEEDIEKISKGVKKIRIEMTEGTIDKEFKKDKIGKIIESHFKFINETYEAGVKAKEDFSSDF